MVTRHDAAAHEEEHAAPAALAGVPPALPRAARHGVVGGWQLDAPLPPLKDGVPPNVVPLREPFPLTHVRLLPDRRDGEEEECGGGRGGGGGQGGGGRRRRSGGGMHLDAQRVNARYLLDTLDHRRLMANFRLTAGLTREAAPYCDVGTPQSYAAAPGACWEAPDCELRGHFTGHYLSALAFLSAGRTTSGPADVQREGDRAKVVVEAIVEEMMAAQSSERTPPGYLSAFDEDVLIRQADAAGVWAPYYTLHKIGQGLLDAHTVAGSEKALEVLRRLANHIRTRVEAVIEERGDAYWFLHALHYPKAAFGSESGGMNELGWQLYRLTGERHFAAFASLFDHPTFLGNMARDKDVLAREHANFHEPLAVGAAVRHEMTGEPEARDAARNLLRMLRRSRAYATAGTCDGERWQRAGQLGEAVRSTETQETCTQVNLERLAQRALGWSGARESADWADYAERAGLHGAMSAQRGPGELLYTMPLGLATSKGRSGHGWGNPTAAFWCCYGTAVEALARLQDGVFWRARAGTEEPAEVAHPEHATRPGTHAHDTVYVARAMTSAEASWPEAKVRVSVEVDPFAASSSPGAAVSPPPACGRACGSSGGYEAALRVVVTPLDAASFATAGSGELPRRLSLRLRVPGWARTLDAVIAPTVDVFGGDGDHERRVSCGETVGAGWCEVNREWTARDVVHARFPLVVRAEPLLGSDGAEVSARQPGRGRGLRHALVAGPMVLAVLGPGAWIGDVAVTVGKSPGSGAPGGFHAGSAEVTDGLWRLDDGGGSSGCDRAVARGAERRRVSMKFVGEEMTATFGARQPRYLGAVAATAEDAVSFWGGEQKRPFARVAPVIVEPLVRPTIGDNPGGSGFFYNRARCDHESCANAMADAPSVTWTLIPGLEIDGEKTFSLEPMTAPGLAFVGIPGVTGDAKRGAGRVILASAPDAAKDEHRLNFRAISVDATILSASHPVDAVTLVVEGTGDVFDGSALCRDETSGRDFPGSSGCSDAKPDCPQWAMQGECIHNQEYMHESCALSCAVCEPPGLRLVPGPATDASAEERRAFAAACAFVVEEENRVAGGEGDGHESVAGGEGHGHESCEGEGCAKWLLPAAAPPGSFVARGPDARLLPFVLMSPLTALRDEVYTVYVRVKGQRSA